MRPSARYLVINRHRCKYPISAMCKFFEVSRSGFYDYMNRHNGNQKEEVLVTMIGECQLRCGRTYGYRRVQIWLMREKGLYLNPKTVLRLMNKYGLLAEIRRRKKYKAMSGLVYKYENLLNRNFTAYKPNAKWVTDISYISTGEGFLYLSMIRDLYDNSIVSYRTSAVQSVNLVLKTIKDAVQKEAVAAEIQLHSDQGFQYTSQAYFSLTQQYGIKPSMSRRGNCYDNALAENFFSILKTECIKRYRPKSLEEARRLIDEYIWFYNNERIQLKTMLTPLEKRRQLA